MGVDTHMIAGSRACSTSSPAHSAQHHQLDKPALCRGPGPSPGIGAALSSLSGRSSLHLTVVTCGTEHIPPAPPDRVLFRGPADGTLSAHALATSSSRGSGSRLQSVWQSGGCHRAAAMPGKCRSANRQGSCRHVPRVVKSRTMGPRYPLEGTSCAHCSRANLAAAVSSVVLAVRSIAASSSGSTGRPRRKP
jgi:hypothetical protein